MSKYCGDTDGKRIARAHLYGCLRRAWRLYRPEGLAIVLCGPYAADVRILTSEAVGIRWPAANILAVDTEPAGLELAKAMGARTYLGDLRHAACADDGPIGFANLDFMGRVGGLAEEVTRTISTQRRRRPWRGTWAQGMTVRRRTGRSVTRGGGWCDS